MKTLFTTHLKGDRTVWMVALILGVVSLLAVYSACSWMVWRHDGGTLRVLFKHGMMLAAGGFIMFAASKVKYTMYSRFAQLALPVTIGLLALTLMIGNNVNGASRWLAIPGLGITFQTSDLARVVILVYLARVLGKHREEPWSFKEVILKLILPVGAVCGLILPANFSTAALLFGTCMIVMFIGQVPIKHMLSIGGIAIGAFLILLVLAKTSPELLPRLQTWEARLSNHGGEDRDANYQVNNAKIAIVSGGFLPNGPGTGTSRNFMPHPESDMIYAFIIEEYGSIIGGLGLLLLYLILLFRAMKISNKVDKDFGKLAAIGLALGLVLQALVNMAVAVNLVPVTGQPLPLVSMGGTSMWFTCLALGVIVSISRSYEPDEPVIKEKRGRTTAADEPDIAIARIMISGGGTGGHIFPAVAIANAIKEREPGTEFLFVGAEGKMEMEKVPAAGYRIEGLPIRGFQRSAMWKNIGLPWRLLKSMLKARKLVREFKPDVAVGVGGYASGPTLDAAQRAGVRTLVQEQNSFPGATNRILSKKVDRICVAYEGMEKFFPAEKILLTGNPVRQEVVRLAGKGPRGLEHFGLREGGPIVFVTGGSLGARGINRGIEAALPLLKEKGIQLIWQTGTPYFKQAQEAANKLGYTDCKVHEFVNKMDYAYAIADLVVARAGAISVSELQLVQLPAILVPLPTAAEDHQTMNARALTDRGAAVLVKDDDAVNMLGTEIIRLIEDEGALMKLRTTIAGLGQQNAAEAIAAEVLRLARS